MPLTAHEFEHAYHAKDSWQTYRLNNDTGGTLAQPREQRAVKESIADINSVIFQNYTGSGFAVPPDCEPISSADDYSDQFDYSDISAGKTDYQNGQVGGHAFYELGKAVGLELASKIFLLGVNWMSDDNSNGKVSFEEMRQGQLDAADALNLSEAETNAIKDAWEDVEIGSAGSGSGANYYDVFHKFGAGAWQLTGSITNNPESFWTTADATLTVRACNGSGCSGLSNDTESATNNCP